MTSLNERNDLFKRKSLCLYYLFSRRSFPTSPLHNIRALPHFACCADIQPVIVDKVRGTISFSQTVSTRGFSSHMLQFTFAGFEVQHIASSETMLTITACALTKTGACPSCGEETSHVHSDYQRHPQDLPISGLQVQLILRVRRFRCLHSQCARHTFADH